MTARGIGWMILVFVVWLVLAYTGLVQLQLLLTTLLLLPLISLTLLLFVRRRVQLTQLLDRSLIRRGETAALQVRIQLSSWQIIGLAELLVEKTKQNDQHQDEKRYAVLQPDAETVVAVKLQARHRGIYPVGLKKLRCRDLFGLFKIGFYSCRREQLDPYLTVLPRPYAFAPLTDLAILLQERQQMRSWKPGNDLDAIANIRQQRPGDALKRAHWKLTARLDELMIREFENPLQQEVVILCDLDRHTAGTFSWQSYGDFFTDSTAHLVRTVLQAGCAVRLVAWPSSGRSEVLADSLDLETRVQMNLAILSESGSWQPENLIAEEAGRCPDARIFVLVTNRLDDATIRQIAQVTLNGLAVWLVLLQSGERLPADNAQTLQPLEQAGVTICRADFSAYSAAEHKSQDTSTVTDKKKKTDRRKIRRGEVR